MATYPSAPLRFNPALGTDLSALFFKFHICADDGILQEADEGDANNGNDCDWW